MPDHRSVPVRRAPLRSWPAPRGAPWRPPKREENPMKRPEPRERPAIAWRSSIVTSVASPTPPCPEASVLASTDESRTSVSADFSTRANGVPSTRWAQVSERSASSQATTLKSARTSLPLRVLITSVNAPSSTSSTRVTRGHQRGRWWGSLITSHSSSAGAAIVRLRFGWHRRLALTLDSDQDAGSSVHAPSRPKACTRPAPVIERRRSCAGRGSAADASGGSPRPRGSRAPRAPLCAAAGCASAARGRESAGAG